MPTDSSKTGFSVEDLRVIIGLCELDHKVTDLLGLRATVQNMVQHRYRVSTVAAKANVLLMGLEAKEIEQMRLPPAAAEQDLEKAPGNGALA